MDLTRFNLSNTCFHNHTIHSDGRYGPAELVRRAQANGMECIAITDHVDSSNLETIVAPSVIAAKELSDLWPILVLSGCEITHAPLQHFSPLTKRARDCKAQLVVAHGETPLEPVLPGTNKAAIKASVDILAHPGFICLEDVQLAIEQQIVLELSLRSKNFEGNTHLLNLLKENDLLDKALLVLNSDSHSAENMKSDSVVTQFFSSCFSQYSDAEIHQLKERVDYSVQFLLGKLLK